MNRILVTGATGLLGSYLLPHLIKSHDVIALGRKRLDAVTSVDETDLGTEWRSTRLPEDVHTVVHLAQSLRYRDFPLGAEDMVMVNAMSAFRLLDYARRVGARRFILASSGSVYAPSTIPLDEAAPVAPPSDQSFYVATRLAAESFASSFRQFMDVHIVRIFFMYGPGQRSDAFLPRLVGAVRDGQSVRLSGTDGIRLNPIHARDAASVLLSLIHSGGPEIVNLAGPDVVTLRQLATRIGGLLGVAPRFEHTTPGVDCVADIALLKSEFDAPLTPIHRGVAEVVASLTSS